MPNSRKCFIHNTLVEVCFRTEEGLPLVAAPYMQVVLRGIFARAQELFFVRVVHFIVMANHVHMLLVVDNPEVVKDFIGYIKCESAHAVNRFLGRAKHTVWCDGYYSSVILNAETAISRIEYLYLNPQTAGLVDSIESYPNLNSWQSFLDGGSQSLNKVISRNIVRALPRATASLAAQQELANYLESEALREAVLYIEPDAWMDCFSETQEADPEAYREEIISRVRAKESELKQSRKMPVLGAHALMLECMDKKYEPKKRSPRMICVSKSKLLRIAFILWFKEMSERAEEAIRVWRETNYLANLPPGFFLPGGKMLASVCPGSVGTW